MISGRDVTSIHMTFNYTCSNTSLSSTTILLGLLSVPFTSQRKRLCSFRHAGACQRSFSLCLGGGEDTHLQPVLVAWQVCDCPHSCSVSSSSLVFFMPLCPVQLSSAHQSSWTHAPLAPWLPLHSRKWLLVLELLKMSIYLLAKVLGYHSTSLKIRTSEGIGNKT